MEWYKYDIRTLTGAEYDAWYALMSEEKRRRVDRLRFAEDKKRTVVGDGLARKAIAARCGVAPEDIVFGIGEHGKPYAVGLPVEFNVSHSADLVVCAVDHRPVGIDVEKIRPVDLKVAKRVCTEEELDYIFGHTPTAQDFTLTADTAVLTRFFERWTVKEAYGKSRGAGLSCKDTPSAACCRTMVEDGYVITICSE